MWLWRSYYSCTYEDYKKSFFWWIYSSVLHCKYCKFIVNTVWIINFINWWFIIQILWFCIRWSSKKVLNVFTSYLFEMQKGNSISISSIELNFYLDPSTIRSFSFCYMYIMKHKIGLLSSSIHSNYINAIKSNQLVLKSLLTRILLLNLINVNIISSIFNLFAFSYLSYHVFFSSTFLIKTSNSISKAQSCVTENIFCALRCLPSRPPWLWLLRMKMCCCTVFFFVVNFHLLHNSFSIF